MAILNIKKNRKGYEVTGETFQAKDAIKAAGGKFSMGSWICASDPTAELTKAGHAVFAPFERVDSDRPMRVAGGNSAIWLPYAGTWMSCDLLMRDDHVIATINDRALDCTAHGVKHSEPII